MTQTVLLKVTTNLWCINRYKLDNKLLSYENGKINL